MHDAPFRRVPMARKGRWIPWGWWTAVRAGNNRGIPRVNAGREERAGRAERRKTKERRARIAARGKGGGPSAGWEGGVEGVRVQE